MVHLSVAKNILEAGFKLSDASQFYLGSVSPDAIHMRQKPDRLTKNDTHLIPAGQKWSTIDDTEYFSFMINFIDEKKDYTDMSFLWGYGLHILTDMYWTKLVYSNFIENYKKDPSPIQDERWAYYNDTDILDQVLFNESRWKNIVWQGLQGVKCSDFFDLLTAQEINAWKERTLHWYDSGESQHKNPIRYITKTDIEKFVDQCSEIIRYKLVTSGYVGPK